MSDRYSSFAGLAAGEKAEIDYRIRCEDRRSPFVVLAPHGGWIEPGTSEIATEIAGSDLSLYLFEGLIPNRPHGDLHIRSHLFDEPIGMKLVQGAETAVAIHGRADNGAPHTIWLGGRDTALSRAIASALREAKFDVAVATGALAGHDRDNICNRGASGAGVQLELPRTLRDELKADQLGLRSFATAVRSALPNGS